MISNVTSYIKSTISAFLENTTTTVNPNASAANRIGPQRVLFWARISGAGGGIKLGDISLSIPFRGFSQSKQSEEAVLVHIINVANDTLPTPHLERRATLKVKADTKWLTVTFADGADRIYKTERIKIK